MAINNTCTFRGRLADEPRVSTNPKAPVKFRLVVEADTGRSFPTKTFVSCVAWGDLSDEARALRAGQEVTVTGWLGNDSYTNKEGQKVSTVSLTVESYGAESPF